MPTWWCTAAGWVTALGQPAIVDSTKAKTLLGWQPRFTGLEALLATVDPGGSSD